LIAQKLCILEEIESTHARVYTTHGIQRQVWNQGSTLRIDDGSAEVGNLNSSVVEGLK